MFLGGSVVKNLPAVLETQVQSLDWEDSPEKGMATHSSILAWRIQWGRGNWGGALQSMGVESWYVQDWKSYQVRCETVFKRTHSSVKGTTSKFSHISLEVYKGIKGITKMGEDVFEECCVMSPRLHPSPPAKREHL